jgi:hypothetical protein
MERKCEYRNCKKDISHKRPNAKFCDRNCKSCESKYKRRRKEELEKWTQNDMAIVNFIKQIKTSI